MKNTFMFILLCTALLTGAELKHINIGNQDFMLTVEEYDVYDSKGEVLRVYKEKRNNDLQFMFSLILKDRTGTCADKAVEDGYYEINGTTVTLYSFWNRRGKAYDAPYGARKQVYTLNSRYDLEQNSSKIYIETQRENYDEESGMKYLFSTPKNDAEKKKLKMYVGAVERKFKGTFVYGEEAKNLIEETKAAMTTKDEVTLELKVMTVTPKTCIIFSDFCKHS